MNPKFKEGDKVFILPELETYLRGPTASLLPTFYSVTKVFPNPFDIRYTFCKLEDDHVLDHSALVGVYEIAPILQDIVQREQARFMSELEGRVTEILRQTIF